MKTENLDADLIQFKLFSKKKKVGPPIKDAFDLHCLTGDYQTKDWLNASNAQMDVRTTTDTGGRKLGGDSVVVNSLFNVTPIICWSSVFCPSFVMHYLVSFLVLQSS